MERRREGHIASLSEILYALLPVDLHLLKLPKKFCANVGFCL